MYRKPHFTIHQLRLIDLYHLEDECSRIDTDETEEELIYCLVNYIIENRQWEIIQFNRLNIWQTYRKAISYARWP